MSIYERVVNASNQSVTYEQTEKHIYGSSRLGVMNTAIPLLGSQNTTYSQTLWAHTVGKRTYELVNHLGNVLSVISDKPIPHDNGSGVVDYYMADILQSTDYSPFHAPLSSRTLYKSSSTLDYRYGGSNGQEKTDEIAGDGNHYTAQYWEYDARLGRRWNTDPILKHNESPYACFANNPIWFLDPNGADTSKVENTMKDIGGKGAIGYLMKSTSFSNLFNSFVNGTNKNILLVFESVKNLTSSEKNVACSTCEIPAETLLYYQNKAVIKMTEKEQESLKNAKITDFSIRIRMNTDPDFGGQEGINRQYIKINAGVTLIHELTVHTEKLAEIIQNAKDGNGNFNGSILYTNYMNHFNSDTDHTQFHGPNKQKTWLNIRNEVLNFMDANSTAFTLKSKPPVLPNYQPGYQLTTHQLFTYLFDLDSNPVKISTQQISK